MKQALPLALTAFLVPIVVAGCGTEGSTRTQSERPLKRRRVAKQSTFESSTGARQMALQNEIGVYDSADIEQTMAAHFEDVRGCYQRAGRAQKYAGGTVTLRFLVQGDGRPSDVLVIGTELGNYDVERCLVEVGREIKFPPPQGRKATTFEYPVEFRSTHEMKVEDIGQDLRADRDVAKLMRTLSDCGSVAEGGASALVYIEPSGGVGSVGLAAERTLDEEAAGCMVKSFRRWRLSRSSANRAGLVVRWRVDIPEVIATADPPRSGPLGPSVRQRRR